MRRGSSPWRCSSSAAPSPPRRGTSSPGDYRSIDYNYIITLLLLFYFIFILIFIFIMAAASPQRVGTSSPGETSAVRVITLNPGRNQCCEGDCYQSFNYRDRHNGRAFPAAPRHPSRFGIYRDSRDQPPSRTPCFDPCCCCCDYHRHRHRHHHHHHHHHCFYSCYSLPFIYIVVLTITVVSVFVIVSE